MKHFDTAKTIPARNARLPSVRPAAALALALLACSPLAAAATADTGVVEPTVATPVDNCCEWNGDGRGK